MVTRVGVDLAKRVIQVHAEDAAGRPHMRFVPVKTPAQQALLDIHHLSEGYKEDRTTCINRLRGLVAEFGIVFAQSPEALLHWIERECHIASCDKRIAAHVGSHEQAKAAAQLAGIGPVTASALMATMGEFTQFKNGAQAQRQDLAVAGAVAGPCGLAKRPW